MSRKKLFQWSALLFAVLLVACSKSDDGSGTDDGSGGGGGSDFTISLASSSSDNVLLLNEAVSFTVSGSDGENYTSAATLVVNEVSVSGSNYTFEATGAFAVYATYDGKQTNTLNFDVVNAGEKFVAVNRESSLRGQAIGFALVDADDNDFTDSATFYVDGVEISGSSFSSDVEGTFEVYASYDLAGEAVDTDAVNFSVIVPKRKVVLEDYTGAWCGYCPRMTTAIEAVRELTDDVVVVAIHNGDPMAHPQEALLRSTFGVTGFPNGRINRTLNWPFPHSTGVPVNYAGADTDLAIGINSQMSGSDLTVTVNVAFEAASSGDKLVVYLVEDGIEYAQTNYYNTDASSPWYQTGNPIPGFIHEDVLRVSMTNVLGDPIPDTPALEDYTVSLSTSIPSTYDPNHMRIVVMVVNSGNSARNAQFANLEENKAYQ